MDILTRLWSWLISIPIVGKIIIVIAIIYAINELICNLTMEKVNPLKSLIDYLPIFRSKRLAKQKKKYYATLDNSEYIEWSKKILQLLYPENKFTKILDFDYPVVCIPASINYQYPFDELLNSDLILELDNYEINHLIQLEYKKILGNTIKRPLLKGYMLTNYEFDENDEIIQVSAKIGTYEQNVYSSHILEFELYKLFLKKIKRVENLPTYKILKLLPFRNNIHKNVTPKNVLYSGINRYCLLGVQIFIVYKDHESFKYNTIVIKRSEDVASKPGYLQFIPSGGFEIFQNYDDEFILIKNYSVKLALFRELLEEVFGEEEFIHNEKGVPEENILKNPKVIALVEMIKNKEAFFEFLGSTVDMISLRHELSFILKIDNVSFSHQTFIPNHESRNIQLYPITELEKRLHANKKYLYQGSAGLLFLVKQNHLYKQIQT